MDSFNQSENEGKENNQNNMIGNIKNVKSKVILKKIFYNLIQNKFLEIIKHNKNLQKAMSLDIIYYKEYSLKQIEIEIIPTENIYGKFINISKQEEKNYRIFFNNNKIEEIKRNYITEYDDVKNINIEINFEVQSLEGLFAWSECIESIIVRKFSKHNIINNMSEMFLNCSNLKRIDLSNFKTNKVTNMSRMFYGCSSLSEINLSNFNTDKVNNIGGIFYGCSSLKGINLSKFNVKNVNDLSNMFYNCSSLKELDVSNFVTDKVKDMNRMFYGCSSLKELNLSNFKTNNVHNMGSMFYKCNSMENLKISNFNFDKVTNMYCMFSGCSEELKKKIKAKFKKIRQEAFD